MVLKGLKVALLNNTIHLYEAYNYMTISESIMRNIQVRNTSTLYSHLVPYISCKQTAKFQVIRT